MSFAKQSCFSRSYFFWELLVSPNLVSTAIVILGIFLAPIAFGGSAKASLFDQFCSEFQQVSEQPLAYTNQKSEYVVNIQMIETFKLFKACQFKDPGVQIKPQFNAKFNEIESAFKKTLSLSQDDISALNFRALRIFNSTQILYLHLLRNLEESPANLTVKKYYAELEQRVSTVRLFKSKNCNMNNAAYDPITHSIHICKEILNYPEATLVAVIAHEFSHSIDPCLLQFSLSSILGSNPFSNKDYISDRSGPLKAYTTIPFEWAESDFDVLRANFQTISPGRAAIENPFYQKIKCLERNESVHAKPRLIPLGDSIINDTEGMCSATTQDGEIQESFSDWMAYEVLALYLKKLPASELKPALFEGVLNITANECSTLQSEIEMEMRTLMLKSPLCSPEAERFFKQVDQLRSQTFMSAHPNGQRRVDRLYLAQPSIRKLIQKAYGLGIEKIFAEKSTLQYCHP
jgi:hypothetical protein